MPRFVVLEHSTPPDSARGLHWDLMFEDGPALLTWALDRPPAAQSQVAAERLPDHRLRYLEYEGPLSDDRGSVTRWDQGTFDWLERSSTLLIAVVQGRRYSGQVQLMHDQAAHCWRVSFGPPDSEAVRGGGDASGE